jgi:hypothetical protein
MSQVNALRKIIREEVTKAIKEVLPQILKEHSVPSQNKANFKSTLKESMTSKVPSTLNEPRKPINKTVKFDKSNPFASMLNETVSDMSDRDVNSLGNTGTMSAMDVYQPEVVNSGTVTDMLSSARPSSNLELVEIDTVPDFSGMMESLKSKGLL